jgi:hypothetical protein
MLQPHCGQAESSPWSPPMDSGTFREEILHQTACLLVRASRNRKAIQNLRDTQRSKPREARSAARNSQKAAAAPSNQRVTKNTRLNPDAEKTASRTKTRRKGEPARAATPDGLPQRGGEAPEIPSPEGLRQRGGGGQGPRTSEGLPQRGKKKTLFEGPMLGCRPLMDTAARDQAQRSKGYSCSNMGDGQGPN